MSLSEILSDPILIVSFDRIAQEQTETSETSSAKKPDVSDAEREARANHSKNYYLILKRT